VLDRFTTESGDRFSERQVLILAQELYSIAMRSTASVTVYPAIVAHWPLVHEYGESIFTAAPGTRTFDGSL
jgi:hypothetical protein